MRVSVLYIQLLEKSDWMNRTFWHSWTLLLNIYSFHLFLVHAILWSPWSDSLVINLQLPSHYLSNDYRLKNQSSWGHFHRRGCCLIMMSENGWSRRSNLFNWHFMLACSRPISHAPSLSVFSLCFRFVLTPHPPTFTLSVQVPDPFSLPLFACSSLNFFCAFFFLYFLVCAHTPFLSPSALWWSLPRHLLYLLIEEEEEEEEAIELLVEPLIRSEEAEGKSGNSSRFSDGRMSGGGEGRTPDGLGGMQPCWVSRLNPSVSCKGWSGGSIITGGGVNKMGYGGWKACLR